MNLLKHVISERQNPPKRDSFYRLHSKKLLSGFGIFLLGISSYFIFGVSQNAVEAYPLGLDKDYAHIIELNEKATAVVPVPILSISTSQTKGDKRIITLLAFLQSKNSPMATFSIAKAFVDHADANGFGDTYYILPAISGIESAFGKLIPYDGKTPSYNGWGWSGGSKNSRWSFFKSWEDAAEKISKQLPRYGVKNLNPESMVRTYCPPCNIPGSPWVRAVNLYINEIKAIEAQVK